MLNAQSSKYTAKRARWLHLEKFLDKLQEKDKPRCWFTRSFVEALSFWFSLTSIILMIQAQAIEHSANAADAPNPIPYRGLSVSGQRYAP
jgi:hypothetical protein